MKKLILITFLFISFFNSIKSEDREILINNEKYIIKLSDAHNGEFDIEGDGLIELFLNKEEIGYLTFKNEDENTSAIELLYIHKKFRNKGFGGYLVKYFCNELHKKVPNKKITLYPDPFELENPKKLNDKEKEEMNKRLENFYEKLGFVSNGGKGWAKEMILTPKK